MLFWNTKPITCYIPKTKINSYANNVYIHAHFIEHLLKAKNNNIKSVNINPLSGFVTLVINSDSETTIKNLLNNLKDHLGNKITVII